MVAGSFFIYNFYMNIKETLRNIMREEDCTPADVDEYGNVTSRATIDVPKGCCFTVAVEYVNGTVNDPATVPTPVINVIDGSLSISRTA